MGNLGSPMCSNQRKRRIDRTGGAGWGARGHGGNGERADTGDAGAGRNGEETSPRRIDRRVCGWRAKHAISSGHLDLRPSWLGLEPGRKFTLPLGLQF